MRILPLVLAFAAGCTALPIARDATYHASDADLGATRITHGSLILEMAGARVFVDPWFHSGFFTRQIEPLGLVPAKLPGAAAVLITHRHAGHFDPAALEEIAKTVPRAIVPPPLAEAVRELGFAEVTPLEWWEATTVGAITVTAVPASHPTRENGYVLASDRVRTYVAGDTRYFDGLVDIATAFPRLDVAFLPIGGERILGLRRTMGPAEATKAATVLDARRIVPIAYGARGGFPFVWYARDPVARFVEDAEDAGLTRERIVVLAPGESWHYYR